jgi:hypothetical protein
LARWKEPQSTTQRIEQTMSGAPYLDSAAAAQLHNRLSQAILPLVITEPIEAGGTISDVLLLCETVIVAVALEFFRPGTDDMLLDAIFQRVKERLVDGRAERQKLSDH